MPAKSLIKTQKTIYAQRGDQKRHSQSGRIAGQKDHSLPYRVLFGGNGQHAGQNGADARRPAKRKCKAQQKTAKSARLTTQISEMDVSIQPPRQSRPKKEN